MPVTTATSAAADRAEAERLVAAELEAWRARALPDPTAPLDADDLAQLVRSCLETLGVGEAVADLSVNTVHYYRRKDILDAPVGRTSSARYALRHLWQAVGARLAGHLGLVTLAEARDVVRGARETTLVAFVCARVVDARARRRLKTPVPLPVRVVARHVRTEPASPGRLAAGVEASAAEAPVAQARPLPGVMTPRVAGVPTVVPLPGDAYCIIPPTHAAHGSPTAARELVTSLARALGIDSR
jgi:hypothetical protein